MDPRHPFHQPLGRIGAADGAQKPFEVFVKSREDGAFEHVGSVRAADPEFAIEWAKEVYTRRSDCFALWVVPRECIVGSRPDARELFRRGYEKEYRRPGYFTQRRRELTRQVQGAHELDEEANGHGDD